MTVRLVCALCGRELHRIGVTRQVVCPLHGSRGVGALTEPGGMAERSGNHDGSTAKRDGVPTPSAGNVQPPSGSVSAPSKPGLRDPDFNFGTER